jgi:hypothetical protein
MGLLSWLNGGRRGTESSGEAASVRAQTPPAAAPAVPAWSELPPLQRALATPGLLSDPAGFRGSLSAWQDTSFQRPLGHLVSPEAPSGLGHGLTSSFTVSRETDEPSPLQSPADPAGDGPLAPVQLQRDTRSVSLASSRPLQTSLQDLPRLTVATPTPSHATGDTETGTVDTSIPAAAPVRRSLQRSAQTELPVERRTFSTSPSAFRTRGFGLGEPLHSLPPTAQRTAGADSSMPLSQLNAPSAEATSESGRAEADGSDASSRPLLGDDPLTTVSRTDETAQETDASPAAEGRILTPPVVRDPVPLQRAAEDGTPLPRLSAPTPESVAPLVAQRSIPLFSGAVAALDHTPTAPLEAAHPTVPVQWTAPGSPDTGRPQTTNAGVPAVSASRATTTPVQRTVTAMSADAPTSAPLSTPASQLQRTAASLPLSAPAAPVDAGAVAVDAGVAQRMADGSVVFQSPTVQRDADTDPPPTDAAAEPPPPSDTPAEPVDPPPEPEPESVSDPGPGSDQPGPSDAHGPHGAHAEKGGGSPKVTDELVRALFAPLSRMLKAELRLDRERAGFLIDTRH